jgi:hypothetical protein
MKIRHFIVRSIKKWFFDMKVIHKWRWVFSIGLIESRFEKDPRKQCELKVLGTYSLIKKN